MAQNGIDDVLDHLGRIKCRGDLSSIKIDQVEKLEMHLRFLRTLIKYHHVLLPDFLVKITKKAKLIVEMLDFSGILDECKSNLNVERLVQLLKFIEGNTSSMCNFELNDSDLSEYMDCLGKNLNDVLMCLELDKSDPSSTNEEILQYNRVLKQVKNIQKKMRFLRYLYATEINGYVDHAKLDVELEMKKIFLGELKASKFTQSRTFKENKLPKGFSHHLNSLLVYLRNKQLENFPNNISAPNINVALEFLLVFLADVPNRFINGKRLNEVLENVGAIVGDILHLIQNLLPRSIIKNDTSEINLNSVQILEKTANLKAQVEESTANP
ncbi:hypothetical protein RND71_002449 [Anisodus tanguticus]|uniref:Uncharacterized protein n=1 Tax=Anisodus tanguticus TaxID=243964 RepID=A0AAE1VT23_9SOLA|nr:hypothetical protein RND71_002449 [Anisodus tanguticus]